MRIFYQSTYMFSFHATNQINTLHRDGTCNETPTTGEYDATPITDQNRPKPQLRSKFVNRHTKGFRIQGCRMTRLDEARPGLGTVQQLLSNESNGIPGPGGFMWSCTGIHQQGGDGIRRHHKDKRRPDRVEMIRPYKVYHASRSTPITIQQEGLG